MSYLGNVRLIDHIVHKGGRELLESTEGLGLTPLFFAATHNHLAATKRLLQLGANLNARQILDHREVNILSCIDTQPHCMSMAKLLIVNGAAGELDSNFLAEAQRQVKLEGEQYLAALFNGESLQEMPIELTKIIAEYSKWHPEIQPPAPPQPVPPSSCCTTT